MLTRAQATRALDFVKRHWPADEVKWLRDLPAAELEHVLTLALMGGVPVDVDLPDSPDPVLVLGTEPVAA